MIVINVVFAFLILVVFAMATVVQKKYSKFNFSFSKQKITVCALLLAMNVVLTIASNYAYVVPFVGSLLRITGDVTIILVSVFYGPFFGVLVGFTANNLGFALSGGIFFAGFLLNACLIGFIPGLLIHLFNKKIGIKPHFLIVTNVAIYLLLMAGWIFQIVQINFWNSFIHELFTSANLLSSLSVEFQGIIILLMGTIGASIFSAFSFFHFYSNKKNTDVLKFTIVCVLLFSPLSLLATPFYFQILLGIPFLISLLPHIILLPIEIFLGSSMSNKAFTLLKKVIVE